MFVYQELDANSMQGFVYNRKCQHVVTLYSSADGFAKCVEYKHDWIFTIQ